MELNPFIIRQVSISVAKIDSARRMQYQMHFFWKNTYSSVHLITFIRIDNLNDDRVFYFIIMVMLGCDRCYPSRCTWYQWGPWSLVSMCKNGYVGMKWSCKSIIWGCLLLILVSNLKEDQSAVVLVVYQVLEVISAVHCQERNEINNNRKENTDRHSRKFLSSSFVYSHQSLLQEFEINSSTSQTSLLKKWSI